MTTELLSTSQIFMIPVFGETQVYRKRERSDKDPPFWTKNK